MPHERTRVLGSAERLRLFLALLERERTVEELAEVLGRSLIDTLFEIVQLQRVGLVAPQTGEPALQFTFPHLTRNSRRDSSGHRSRRRSTRTRGECEPKSAAAGMGRRSVTINSVAPRCSVSVRRQCRLAIFGRGIEVMCLTLET